MTGNQKIGIMAPIIPQIKKGALRVEGSDWSILYYEEFADTIESSLAVLADELKAHCEADHKPHRVQIVVRGIPLLFGIFGPDKIIKTYSPRLGRELFLLEQIEQNSDELVCQSLIESEAYQFFKDYCESVAGLALYTFPSQHELVTSRYKLADLMGDKFYREVEDAIEDKVGSLVTYINAYEPSLFEKFSDFGLDLTARFALLRVHLLKFLAILPSLDHDTEGTEVKRILIETFRRLISDSVKAKLLRKKGQEAPLPAWIVICLQFGLWLFKLLPAGFLANCVRSSVRIMAKRFIAGENIESVEHSLKGLFNTQRDVTLDQLGELVVSEKEADHYCQEVINLISGFGLHVRKGEKNKAGINRAHVSIKVSALCSDFKPHAPEYTYELVAPRLKKILLKAREFDVFINIDAEHYDYRDIVFFCYSKVLLETEELADYQQTGIVLQAYLRDGCAHLDDIIELARKRGLMMPIRIVKGAYWDAETVEADAHNFDAPEFLNKEETDLNFRQLIVRIMENCPHVQLCLASHNFADHCFAEVVREKRFSDIPEIEHQCLHMTYEALSVGLAQMGWPTRNYVPVGSLLVGMAYLVRRIMENSSQVGVLTIMRSHKKSGRLEGPMIVHQKKKDDWQLQYDLTVSHLTSEFFNITPVRLYVKKQWDVVNDAYKDFLKNGLGKTYSSEHATEGELHQILSSSDSSILVGEIKFATVEETLRAIDTVEKSYEEGSWSKMFWLTRCSILLKAADIMLDRRNELSALISYEAGKSIIEAYGDVDEAIDFLTYYAREERKITVHSNKMVSRGPIAAITPWNFPLAIPTGMVAGPLVAGNPVILKAAEQTPLIASELIDIFYEAGVPKDALIYLPGLGEEVGQTLVESDKIAGYVFTGSKGVGQMISHKVATRFYENKLYKMKFPVKAVTELGGKNAIIITANAELDETVAGILYSAFAHAGQKCSAASRIIVDESVKKRLIERLREAVHDIEVSEAFKFSCSLNPVISLEDRDRLRSQIAEASTEAFNNGGRIIIDRSQDDLPGLCVGPAVIEVPKKLAMDKNSFATKELFGPVVHIVGFTGLDEALEIYHAPDYALTGGVFSQSQDDIDYLTSKMESGNIYVNRSITGARVGIEPFGGFKLSGTGPKAGGKVYIPAFHIHRRKINPSKVICEEGIHSTVELSGRSGLGAQMRVERIGLALESVIYHFEMFFKGIRGPEKKLVFKFNKWITKNAFEYMTKEHQNRKIPGQLSFSNFEMQGEHALCIAGSEVPRADVFLQVSAALLMGTGVTVLCRNEASYKWWCGVLNYFHNAGVSKENFNVSFPTKTAFDQALKHPLVNFYIIDGDEAWVKEVNGIIFDENYSERRIRQILTGFDSFNPTDFKRLCGNFIWVRSFAVNTMRHGAPLDLDLNVEV